MTDNDNAQEDILQGDEAIELFKKGKDAWNAEMQSSPRPVSFERVGFVKPDLNSVVRRSGFRGFIFPRGVSFSGAHFGEGDVDFSWAHFGNGNVSFFEAKFGDGDVRFFGAKFGEGYVDFSWAHFGNGNVSFNWATFGNGNVDFRGAKFGDGDVNFFVAKFGDGDVRFSAAKFGNGDVYFTKAKFGKNCKIIDFNNIKVEGAFDFRVNPILSKNGVTFNGSSFGGVFRLDGVESAGPIDLRETALTHHISLNNTKIKLPREWKSGLLVAEDPDGSAKFQRLKELATGASDHERQLDFFAKEMRAARRHETKGLRLILDLLYSWVSNYGISIKGPLWGLLILWFSFSCIYMSYEEPAKARKHAEDFVLSDFSIYSFGQMVPLSSSARAASDLGKGKDGIFKCDSETDRKCAGGKFASVYYWSILQNILAAILLFLLGLALRNRFRL